MSQTLLIQSSIRGEQSVSRKLARDLAAKFGNVKTRDLADGHVPMIDNEWVRVARQKDPNEYSDADRRKVALSDELIDEIKTADRIVIGLPIYNFGAPAQIKAWFDHLARAGVTFTYTETGPKGLLNDKPVYVVASSDGTAIGSEVDFATDWLRFVFGFVGITNLTIIPADQNAMNGGEGAKSAAAEIDKIAA